MAAAVSSRGGGGGGGSDREMSRSRSCSTAAAATSNRYCSLVLFEAAVLPVCSLTGNYGLTWYACHYLIGIVVTTATGWEWRSS